MQGDQKRMAMANILQKITGYFIKNGENHLKPVESSGYTLQIKQSRTEGRLPYLCIYTYGSPKPEFISTIYEPRTIGGLWNIEYNRIRFEASETQPGIIFIYQVSKNAKTGTKA